MINRRVGPPVQEIGKLKLPPPEIIHLDNGMPVYITNKGTQEVAKMEIVFNAGRPYENKPLAGRCTTALLKEGTQNYTGAEIAELVDFYGCTLSTPSNLDHSTIQLYSLSRHFGDMLPVVADMLFRPSFPQEELDAYLNRNIRRLTVDLTRNDLVAYREITAYIFGESHPYGYNSTPELYRAIEREDLVKHFNQCFTPENGKIFLSGKISTELVERLNAEIGQLDRSGRPQRNNMSVIGEAPRKVRIPGKQEDQVQAAIRVGKRLFSRQHPDFRGIQITNTLLGGYFGSRLMENIREDKGYTYNIYSSLDTMRYDGYFYIATEVGTEFVEPTLKEIYKELEVLQNELPSESEVSMLKNYLLGNMLTTLDGPFNVSDIVRSIYTEDLSVHALEEMDDLIRSITPTQIRDFAQRYLSAEEMWEVIVG